MTRTVPDRLWLVKAFLNSVEIAETGPDDAIALDRFGSWLATQAPLAAELGRPHTAARLAGAIPEAGDLLLARRLRDELRAEAVTHHRGGAPRDPAGLRAVAAELPLVVHWPDLVPAGHGARAVLSEVLADIVLAGEPDWRRMKVCPADDCGWAYYDASKNSSRRWCSMDICGNRSKTKAYRQRQAAHATTATP
ncbi:CGNR zinc finger domain-containing protein [Longispora albida]|uniref:CGNR zinc finger domain-containing protein n=1 Tax=Longispora albida TaxID=203523 RepID=UPI00036617E5|nr:CGNR zinc finger domain-containing protein [Longispora albida]